jgi:hypothetical protein
VLGLIRYGSSITFKVSTKWARFCIESGMANPIPLTVIPEPEPMARLVMVLKVAPAIIGKEIAISCAGSATLFC